MKASLLQRAWCPLKRLVSRAFGTRMVGGWVRGDGEWLANTRLSNTVALFAPERMMLGDHVFIGHFSVVDATYGLTIGEGCQIGFFTGIFTHSSHAAIRLYGRAYVYTAEKKAYHTAPVEIGDYSFVGAHATILPGTRIGKGSIVTAYSMVKGEHPDFAILAGNPAVVIGDTRSGDATLLKSHPELRANYEAWAGRDTPAPRPGSH
jgi:acetyltransferase-like isoleucine patch superfamily enzyme